MPEPSPGAVLRAEREELGVTVREVAETLNLSMSTIEAIESDDLERLPGAVFTRGYVRAYARLLELDPRPLLEHYPKAPDQVSADAAAEPPVWEWIRRRPEVVLGGAGAVLVVLLIVVAVAVWPEGEAPAPEDAGAAVGVGQPEVPAGTLPAPDSSEEAAVAETRSVGESESPAQIPAAEGAAPLPAEARSGQGRPADVLPGPVGYAVAAAPSGGQRRITAGGEDLLSFGFSDDCWVEVKSADGRRLYSDLSRAGAELELVGQGPFRILLGYAPGVRLTFNGEPVPLAPHTRDNVATLVLGQ